MLYSKVVSIYVLIQRKCHLYAICMAYTYAINGHHYTTFYENYIYFETKLISLRKMLKIIVLRFSERCK